MSCLRPVFLPLSVGEYGGDSGPDGRVGQSVPSGRLMAESELADGADGLHGDERDEDPRGFFVVRFDLLLLCCRVVVFPPGGNPTGTAGNHFLWLSRYWSQATMNKPTELILLAAVKIQPNHSCKRIGFPPSCCMRHIYDNSTSFI